MAVDKNALLKLLQWAVQNGVSDVHLREGEAPALRIKGDLAAVKAVAYTAADLKDICTIITGEPFDPKGHDLLREIDGSFEVPSVARFRYNIFKHDQKLGVVMRLIPLKVPTIESLGFSDVIRRIALSERGFVLVTGATGSGKSTTLAAMIDLLNQKRHAHIITIEDPVEFIHTPVKSRISQREIGRDTSTFASALRAALRQDPDVILVGEMRDIESIDIALKAAETGHLVFSTVHTTDAPKTIGRLVSMFPAEEQQMVRLRLADALKATISQRLLKRVDGNGRIVAQEIMIVNTAIQECIVDAARTAEIPTFMENATDTLGSQTFTQNLKQLYASGIISLETAKNASPNGADFERDLKFEKTNGSFSQILSSNIQLESPPEVSEANRRKNGTESDS